MFALSFHDNWRRLARVRIDAKYKHDPVFETTEVSCDIALRNVQQLRQLQISVTF